MLFTRCLVLGLLLGTALLLPCPTVAWMEPVDDAGMSAPASNPQGPNLGTGEGPRTGTRFVVVIDATAPRPDRAAARADVRSIVAEHGGQVALESLDDRNPFVVFECPNAASAAAIAQAASTARGVSHVEEDAVRYLMSRPLQTEEILSAAPRKLQQAAIQPYGLTNVQANLFTTAQRSTTSSVDPTKKFPICIIDSGFDASHPGLAGVRVLNGDPAGYNTDTCGHGTHVAGTISARNTIDGVLNGYVELNIVKVFDGPSCGWSYASSLAVAMQKCEGYNAKVVSMSLGGSSISTVENNQIEKMYKGGMLVFAAAGNAGTNDTSYPAGYANAISIAAVNINNTKAVFSQFNPDVELSAPGVAVLSTIPASVGGPTLSIAVEGSAPLDTAGGMLKTMTGTTLKNFTGGAINCAANSCPAGVAGKVCIIPRGTTSFCDKATMCAAAGGVAAIIYNNVPGPFTGTLQSCPSGATIPSFSLAQELAAQFADGLMVTGSVGPNTMYAYYDGTSMATPHASAVAALVWSQRPTCSNAVIRCALRRSALDLGDAGRDSSYGFGLIRAQAAVDSLAGGCTCN